MLLLAGHELGWLSRCSDSLRAGWSGDRILMQATFSAPVHTGPGADPASYTMVTGSFPGIKRPGRGVDDPPLSSAEVTERIQLYLYSTFGFSRPILGWPLSLPLFAGQWIEATGFSETTIAAVSPRLHPQGRRVVNLMWYIFFSEMIRSYHKSIIGYPVLLSVCFYLYSIRRYWTDFY